MKSFFILFILLILDFTSYSQTHISGYTLYGTHLIEIHYTGAAYGYVYQKVTAYPDTNGNFSISISCKDITTVSLSPTVGKTTYLFLLPGDSIHIDYADSLTGDFILSGSAATVNKVYNSYLDYHRQLIPATKEDLNKECTSRLTPNEMDSCIKMKYKISSAFLNNLIQTPGLPKHFVKFLKTESLYKYINGRILYPGSYAYVNKVEVTDFLDDSWWNFLDTISISNKELMVSGEYRRFLNYYLYNYYYPFKLGHDHSDTTIAKIAVLYDLVKQEYDTGIQCFAMSQFLEMEFMWSPLSSVQQTYENYIADCGSTIYGKRTKWLYNKQFALAPGNVAPAIVAQTFPGDTFDLQNLKGKLVVVDFWASWCTPCIIDMLNFKYYKEQLLAKYSNIEFVYISIDKKEDMWRNAVEKMEIQGTHIRIEGENSPIAEDYNILAVPQMYVLDSETKIVTSTPPRNAKGLYEYLLELIDDQEK